MRPSKRFGKNTLAKPTGSLEEALAALRVEFAASLPERRDSLSNAWRDLTDRGWDTESQNAAYHAVHSLAGAAETFGFSEIGQAARALNDWLHDLLEANNHSADQRAVAQQLYDTLATALADAVS